MPPVGNPIDQKVLACLAELEEAMLRIGSVDPVGADIHAQSTSATHPQYYPPTARNMWKKFRYMCNTQQDASVTLSEFKRCLMLLRLPAAIPSSPTSQQKNALQAAGKSKIPRKAPTIAVVDDAIARAVFDCLDCDGNGSLDFKDFASFFTGATTTRERLASKAERAKRAKEGMSRALELAKGATPEEVARGHAALCDKFARREKEGGRIELFYKFKWACNAVTNNFTIDEFTRGCKHMGLVGVNAAVAAAIFVAADVDGSGVLDFNDWTNVFFSPDVLDGQRGLRVGLPLADYRPAPRDADVDAVLATLRAKLCAAVEGGNRLARGRFSSSAERALRSTTHGSSITSSKSRCRSSE